MMKALVPRLLPFSLITIGLFVIVLNATSLFQGYRAIEKLEPSDIDLTSFSQTNPQMAKKLVEKKSFPLYTASPKSGEKLGELTIPRLKQSFPVFEGTSNQVLKKGVGHFSKSVLPGEKNNCVLSGHRDTLFWGLGELSLHDELIVTTEAGRFLYKIRSIKIVDADDTTVMTPKHKATLTLTTCYPFYFIGNAPQRYVLTADLIKGSRM